MVLEKHDDVDEKTKAPFTVVATTTTHDESGGLRVENQTIEADTLKELKRQMNAVEGIIQMQNLKLGKGTKITFSHVMQLDPEKNEYIPLQIRNLVSRVFEAFSQIIGKEAYVKTE